MINSSSSFFSLLLNIRNWGILLLRIRWWNIRFGQICGSLAIFIDASCTQIKFYGPLFRRFDDSIFRMIESIMAISAQIEDEHAFTLEKFPKLRLWNRFSNLDHGLTTLRVSMGLRRRRSFHNFVLERLRRSCHGIFFCKKWNQMKWRKWKMYEIRRFLY